MVNKSQFQFSTFNGATSPIILLPNLHLFQNKLKMTAQSVCQYEKFGICKRKQECDFFHPTSVCDDQKCIIKLCRKRHPLICRYYASVGNCRFNEACKFDHKKVDDMKLSQSHFNDMEIKLKSKIDILEKKCEHEKKTLESKLVQMKQDYEAKVNDMEKRFLLLISENERKHKFEHEDLKIICKNNERVIEVLKDDNKKMKEEMLHILKDQVECTRTHGDVKRKWIESEDNSDNSEEKKSKIDTQEGIVTVERFNKIQNTMKEINERLNDLENVNHDDENQYQNLYKILQDDPVVPEFKRIKEFIVKNKMITKNVEKVKEMINKVVIECERKGKNSPNLDKRTNVFLQVFGNINMNIQTTNIPNIKFRTFAISEINRLINLCENEQKVSE